MTKEERIALESILESCEELTKQSEKIIQLLGNRKKKTYKVYFKRLWQRRKLSHLRQEG